MIDSHQSWQVEFLLVPGFTCLASLDNTCCPSHLADLIDYIILGLFIFFMSYVHCLFFPEPEKYLIFPLKAIYFNRWVVLWSDLILPSSGCIAQTFNVRWEKFWRNFLVFIQGVCTEPVPVSQDVSGSQDTLLWYRSFPFLRYDRVWLCWISHRRVLL